MHSIRSVGLLAKKENLRAQKLVQVLLPWLKKQNVEAVFSQDKFSSNSIDLLISLGGDGTLLKGVRLLHGTKIPILGINLGQFGFLSELSPDDVEKNLLPFLKGDFRIEERLKLKAAVLKKGGEKVTFHALNDIVLHTSDLARISTYKVWVNGKHLTTLKSDGVLTATPTGSTAYSLAAGGPVVDPKNEVLIFTPICPQGLANRPVIFSQDSVISIELLSLNSEVLLTADGQEGFQLQEGDKIEIQKSDKKAFFARAKKDNYLEILSKKIFLNK